jgi:hypothetical protein
MPYGSCRSARQTVVEASRERIPIERNISGAGKIVGAFLGVKRSSRSPRAFQRLETVRAASFRSRVLSLAKACSIGFRSGL